MSEAQAVNNRRNVLIALAAIVVVFAGVALSRTWAAYSRRERDDRNAGLIPPRKSDGSPMAPPPGTAKAPPVLRPPNAAELAVIAPVTVGSTLEGFRINAIQGTDAGHLSLLVSNAEQPTAAFQLQVFLTGTQGPPPPGVGGRYAIYYKGDRYDPSVGKVIAALAQIVGKNDAPPPPGMTAYKTD
jgi:hypothetical protein